MTILLVLFYAILAYCVIGALTGLALTIQRRGIRYLPAGVLLTTALIWPVLLCGLAWGYACRIWEEL